jgi:predicted amidohydrolase
MNVRVQQLNPTIGEIQGNQTLITEAIKAAGKAEVDILILPELVVAGYPPMLQSSQKLKESVQP